MYALAILVHAPVPVGHRVEVLWYEGAGGMFGTKPKVQMFEPLVIDLDTGIEYAPKWLYGDALDGRSGKPWALAATRRPWRAAMALTGVVRRCRITTHITGPGTPSLQTDLEIESEGPVTLPR